MSNQTCKQSNKNTVDIKICSNFQIKIHDSWSNFWDNENNKEKVKKIFNKIGEDYFPKKENIFRFMQNDLTQIKCIIIGMDPYPSCYKKNDECIPNATGRSFEVASLESWQDKINQKSLINIIKTIYYNKTGKKVSIDEIRKKLKSDEFELSEPKLWFDKTEKQGVLWLNAALTVKQGQAGSHITDWEEFMNMVFCYIKQKNHCAIWCLWGKKAQEKVKIDKDKCICSS
ncbi:MAG: hypothetical protein J6W29_09030, partial [Neisseriaceae bacterium]|nr:hypothetical protein [Neisseriaceae bacterium]